MATPTRPSHAGEPSTRPHATTEEARSVPALVTELGRETADLLRQELALARTEMDEKLTQAKRGVISLLASTVVLLAGLVVLLWSAVYGLTFVLPLWAAALIVGGGVVVIGAVLMGGGVSALRVEKLAPRQTVQSLRTDQRFAQEQLS